jgi:hypothetical protein
MVLADFIPAGGNHQRSFHKIHITSTIPSGHSVPLAVTPGQQLSPGHIRKPLEGTARLPDRLRQCFVSAFRLLSPRL